MLLRGLFVRLATPMRRRPDAEWPARRFRRGFGIGPEIDPAAGTEPGFVPDHADRDPLDIGNFGTAQPKRVTAAGLLLIGGIGPGRHGPEHQRQ